MKNNEPSVLVVDDMKVARLRMQAVCKMCGFKNIFEAANGKEAWSIIAKENLRPVLILSDYNMPDMNGLEFLDLVRKNETTKNIPVLFVTSESEKSFIMNAVLSGVTEVVIKPYTDDVLVEKIKTIMAKT